MVHRQASFVDVFLIIFSSFDCILPVLPCVRPSIISSLVKTHWWNTVFTYYVALWFLLPPLLSVYLVSLRLAWQARHWSANVRDRPLRSAVPHTGMQGAKNDLLCLKGFSYTHTRTYIHIAFRDKDSFHLHKHSNSGHDYCRERRLPFVPIPNSA